MWTYRHWECSLKKIAEKFLPFSRISFIQCQKPFEKIGLSGNKACFPQASFLTRRTQCWQPCRFYFKQKVHTFILKDGERKKSKKKVSSNLSNKQLECKICKTFRQKAKKVFRSISENEWEKQKYSILRLIPLALRRASTHWYYLTIYPLAHSLRSLTGSAHFASRLYYCSALRALPFVTHLLWLSALDLRLPLAYIIAQLFELRLFNSVSPNKKISRYKITWECPNLVIHKICDLLVKTFPMMYHM